MPYLNCPECRLTVYSAAAYSTVDSCPRCEAALGHAPRRLFDISRLDGQAQAEDTDGYRAGLGEGGTPKDAEDFWPSRA